jgi:hypothetical protein
LIALSPATLDLVKPAPEECQPFPNPSAHILLRQAVENQESKCGHLRSCIWALGETAIDHNAVSDVAETLLRCAKHENQLIRMEAYIALIKAGIASAGEVLLDRFTRIVDGNLAYLVSCRWWDLSITLAEADIIADWIERYGAATDKEAFRAILSQTITRLPTDATIPSGCDAWGNIYLFDWPFWLVYRGIMRPDDGVVASLESLRAKFPDTDPTVLFLLKAEALCGSSEAVPSAARWLAEAQSRVLPGLEGPVRGGYGRLTLPGESGRSLRDLVLRVGTRGDNDSGMFAEINGTILRATLTSYELDDWYRLYLLAQIENPQVPDTEMIRTIWDTGDEDKRLVAVDVLWLWGDAETMRELYDQCDQSKVRWEIGRLVADLERTPHR